MDEKQISTIRYLDTNDYTAMRQIDYDFSCRREYILGFVGIFD